MIFVLSGQCLNTLGGHAVEMRKGDICLIQPGAEHSIEVYDDSIIVNFLIRRSTFREFFLDMIRGEHILSSFFLSSLYSGHGNNYLIFHTGDDEEIRNSMLRLYELHKNEQKYYMEIINSMLITVFMLLLRDYESSCERPQTSPNHVKGLEIISYMQSKYDSVSLDDISEHFFYSKEYISRLIKLATGKSYIQALTQIRLENAKALLRNSRLSISDVATTVGYPNVENFIRAFKKAYLVTPNGYRNATTTDAG